MKNEKITLKDIFCLSAFVGYICFLAYLFFLLFSACFNQTKYNYAKISLPSGKVVEGKVSSYEKCGGRYENDIEVKLSNGQKFYTEMSNVVLYNK